MNVWIFSALNSNVFCCEPNVLVNDLAGEVDVEIGATTVCGFHFQFGILFCFGGLVTFVFEESFEKLFVELVIPTDKIRAFVNNAKGGENGAGSSEEDLATGFDAGTGESERGAFVSCKAGNNGVMFEILMDKGDGACTLEEEAIGFAPLWFWDVAHKEDAAAG